MCWNSKVSLNTFLFSLFGISFAYFNNVIDIFIYLFFLSFISIQLVEYFTWKNINDKKMNTFLSQIGLFLILIQPPLFILSRKITHKLKAFLIGLYSFFTIFCILNYTIDFSMKRAINGHLAWNWLNFPIIIILIWVSFSFGLILYEGRYIEFIVYLLLFLVIYYTYYKYNTWGSLWCWIANLLALKLIIQVFLDYKC
jgi:hypothetical protein